MNIKPIRTEEQYDDALAQIYHLLQSAPRPGTPEGDEMEVLAILVEAYEAIHYPMTASDPVAYLNYKISGLGLKQADLVTYIGDKTSVSKILNRKRELTLPMIRRLSKGLNIPLHRLVGG